jgi:hypothetical protein
LQIGDRIQEIETAARRYAFVRQVVRVDETYYSVKYRLTIEPDLFVQVYFNERSGTAGLVLVYRGERLYGRDCESGNWHRHPIKDPAAHDVSPEGLRAVSVDEFLGKVQAILVRENLI